MDSGAKTIMLIDDEEIDNLINGKIVEKSGLGKPRYVFKESTAAIEFLRIMSKQETEADQPFPDLIFLDINMPLLDGFQFLNLFDSLPEEQRKETFIIMLSSSINPEDKARALSNKHVLAFLTKPLSHSVLNEVKTMLQTREGRKI